MKKIKILLLCICAAVLNANDLKECQTLKDRIDGCVETTTYHDGTKLKEIYHNKQLQATEKYYANNQLLSRVVGDKVVESYSEDGKFFYKFDPETGKMQRRLKYGLDNSSSALKYIIVDIVDNKPVSYYCPDGTKLDLEPMVQKAAKMDGMYRNLLEKIAENYSDDSMQYEYRDEFVQYITFKSGGSLRKVLNAANIWDKKDKRTVAEQFCNITDKPKQETVYSY